MEGLGAAEGPDVHGIGREMTDKGGAGVTRELGGAWGLTYHGGAEVA